MLAERQKEAAFELFFNWPLSLISRNIKRMLKFLVFLQWCIYVLVQPAKELLHCLKMQMKFQIYKIPPRYMSLTVHVCIFVFLLRSYESVPRWLTLLLWGWRPIKLSMARIP